MFKKLITQFDLAWRTDWMRLARSNLHDRWASTTSHNEGATQGTWACELAKYCHYEGSQHLSIACTLLADANEISIFLKNPGLDVAPETFLRLYLFLLSEFVGVLTDISGLLHLKILKVPRELFVWAHRWAKHRLHICVQHHATVIFVDAFTEDEQTVYEAFRNGYALTNRGKTPLTIIDTEWLKNRAKGKSPDLGTANLHSSIIILVPPLQTFLDPVIDIYRAFIDRIHSDPSVLAPLFKKPSKSSLEHSAE